MPCRVFFHIRTVDGTSDEDDVGADFPSRGAAIMEAEALAQDMLLDATRTGDNVKIFIDVADERGRVVRRLNCSGPIEVRGSTAA
jgi:hypothetical protein